MNISVDKLRYFIEVAEIEHVNNAAKRLNISASSISEAIKSIEIELSVKLFYRVNRSIKLTSEGHDTLAKAKEVLKSLDKLYQLNTSELSGNLKIGISLSLFRYSTFDLKKLTKISDNNKKLNISFNTSDTGKLIDLVIQGLLDLAVVYSPLKHELLKEEILEETSFKIALKKNHPIFDLPKKKQIQMLNSLPAIGFNASVGDNMCQRHPIFDKYGITPNYRYFYDVDEVAIALSKSTEGWIFTSTNIIENNKVIKALDLFEVPMNISIIYNRNKPRPKILGQLF